MKRIPQEKFGVKQGGFWNDAKGAISVSTKTGNHANASERGLCLPFLLQIPEKGELVKPGPAKSKRFAYKLSSIIRICFIPFAAPCFVCCTIGGGIRLKSVRLHGRPLGRQSMLFQMIALFVAPTVIATMLTGWLIYDRAASQLIDNAWAQNEMLLGAARASINRQFLQVRSFAWQLSNSDKVVSAMYAKEQTPDTILNTRDIIALLQGMKAFMDTIADIGMHLYNSDTVITGESSCNAEKYYLQSSPQMGAYVRGLLAANGGRSMPCAYAGNHTVNRLISKDEVLTFVSGLNPLRGLE